MAARGFAVLLLVLIGLVGLSVNSLAKENPGHHYGRCCNPGHHYGQLKHQLPPAPHPGPAPVPGSGGVHTVGGPQTYTQGVGGQPSSSPSTIALPAFHLKLPFDTQPAVQRVPVPTTESWLLLLALLGLAVLWLWAATRGTLVAVRRRRSAVAAAGASPAA